MIQKLQTYLTRFINWLEDNSETRFIRSVLRSNEDVELTRLYEKINHLRDRLITLADKLNCNNQEFEAAINSAYSHIKRKQKMLKLPEGVFANASQPDSERELRVATIKEITLVASNLKKLYERTKKAKDIKPAEQIIMNIQSETICDMVLASFRDVSTTEGTLINIKEVR